MYEFLKNIPKDCEVSFIRDSAGDFKIRINKKYDNFKRVCQISVNEIDIDRNDGNWYVFDILKTAYETL